MSEYILSTCSTCDLSKSHCEERNINYVCFHFSINDDSYLDDLGQSMPHSEFYKVIKNKNIVTKTSQVNIGEYISYFTPFLEAGKDIFHLCMSSGLSGAYTSAMVAKADLEVQFPERKIYIVDSLAASSGLGLFVDTLADMRDAGASIDELKDWALQNRLRFNHWFFATDLTFFVRGGRISKTAGLMGTVLRICPVLNVDTEGKLVPVSKVRTRDRAINELLDKMVENAENGLDYSKKCFISHSDCIADAEILAQAIESKFPKLNGKVLINNIGTTIGSHSGPGTVALFFFGNERT